MADQQHRSRSTSPSFPTSSPTTPRTYANFCSIAHTPFDFTLTFCEVMPLSDKEIKEAESEHVVRAPVRAQVVVPVQFVPNLIAALQEHWRVFSESYSNVGWNKGAGRITLSVQLASTGSDEDAQRDARDPRRARDAASGRRHRAALPNAFELLVATILSAQSTDARVNMVTPALFKRYPDARALAAATTEELEPQIHSTGFFRAKSKALDRHGAGARRDARRRGAADMEALDRAAGRRPQDGERRARARARRARAAGRSARAARRQPHRHRRIRRSGGRRTAVVRGAAAGSAGRAPPTR